MNRRLWVAVGLAFVAVMGWLLLNDPGSVEVSDRGPVAQDPSAALALADSICDCDGPDVNPECRTEIIPAAAHRTNAAPAPVIILLHGFTNCPKQFRPLALELSHMGYHVVVPLLPRHGRADVMTTELSRLHAEELVRAGEQAMDVAHGLGRPVTVLGLSSSAVLAAWLAQHRDDVDAAILLAPSFGPKGLPPAMVRPLTNALLHLPNFYVWWDAKVRDKNPGPRQCYPRFASRAIGEVYRLGAVVLRDASLAKPKARRLVLVTTAGDDAVNNDLCAELGRRWRAHGARVEGFQFAAPLGVRHDMIDVEQPYQRTRIVYPVLEKIVASTAPG